MAFGKKEVNYFELLSGMVACSHTAAQRLEQMLKNYTDVEKQADEIHDIEHQGDQLLHSLVAELNRAFITPIDREDILQIADGIDSITDAIEDVANLFDMLSIESVQDEAKEMAVLTVRCSHALCKAIGEFQHFKHSKLLNEMIVDVNHIEEEGDRLHRRVVKALYRNKDLQTLEIIKWKEIYDAMENILDTCEDVADMLEGLVVKNG